MEIGYRIIRPEDVGAHPLSLAQISLWKSADWGVAEGERAVQEAIDMAAECRKRGIRTVIHPLDYSLSNEYAEESLAVMRRLATGCDLGIIIHDEGGQDGQRLSDSAASRFEKHLREVSSQCPVSVENAFNSGDAAWFWERFVDPGQERISITVDIGHLETAGMDSLSILRVMPRRMVDRIRFVHIHHQGEERSGVKDHWPLVPGCRELEALTVLLQRKRDVRVILELDAMEDGVRESIELLKKL